MELESTNALVTGASRGLGRALAAELSARGATVVMVARGRAPLEEAVRAIREAGGRAHAVVADVAAPDAAARIVGAAAAMAGPLDLVIHNASTLGPVPLRPLADTADDDLERAVAVNLLAPHRLTRAVIGSMVQRGAGTIVHVSSDAGVEAYPSWGAYGASKAALDHLGRTWAAELHGTGVRVFSVDPGEMDTEMHAQADPEADPTALAAPEVVARAIVRLIAEPELAPSGSRRLAADVRAEGGRAAEVRADDVRATGSRAEDARAAEVLAGDALAGDALAGDVLAGDVLTDDVLTDDVLTDDVLTDDVLTDDVLTDDVLTDDVLTDDVLTDDVLAGDVLTKDVLTKDVLTNDVQADDVQADDVQADDVQANDVLTNDVQADDVQAGDVLTNDVQAGDVQAGDVQADEVRS